MKADEKNLIQAKYIAHCEFEIANKEYFREQKGWKLFRKSLDYSSFVRGFVKGLQAHKRGITNSFEDEEKK